MTKPTQNRGREAGENASDGFPEAAEETQEKHDKVLHTRISPTLDREIKRRARNLGMSVSTVVRNVLLHTFDLVEDIVNDSAGVALSIAGEDGESDLAGKRDAARTRRDVDTRDNPVVGWQDAVLNVNAVCERCNEILAIGTKAAIGVHDRPGPRTILCTACVERISGEPDRFRPSRSAR